MGNEHVDSSAWKRPVSDTGLHGKPKEKYTEGAIARPESTGTGIRTGKRTPEPDPSAIVRNFGRQPGQD